MLNRLKQTLKALWPVAVAYFKATNPQYTMPITVLDKTVRDTVTKLELDWDTERLIDEHRDSKTKSD